MSCRIEPLNDEVHPADTTISDDSSDDTTERIPIIELREESESQSKSNAWEEDKSMATKSLGRNVGLRVSQFTNHYSGEESDDENENVCMKKTQSLGRKEINNVVTGYRAKNIIPVSERSAAYRELITSSKKSSPKHSVMSLNDAVSVKSRIESNPFFQLDKQTIDLKQKRRSTTSSNQTKVSIASKNTLLSPPVAGMSVQMRIKIWKEKEEDARHQKIEYRKSLQSTLSLVAVESKDDDVQIGNEERNAQSDDEMMKGSYNKQADIDSTKTPRQNVYEEISDTAKRYRIDEAFSSSSSSDSSPASTPVKTSRKALKKLEDSELKDAKKKTEDDLKKKNRSIWSNLRSPLAKRKNKGKESAAKKEPGNISGEEIDKVTKKSYRMSYNRRAVMKKKTSYESSRDDEISDEVFSPTHEIDNENESTTFEERKLNTAMERQLSINEKLPTLFNKVDTGSTPGSGDSPSISQDILNIIDSLGTIEEKNDGKLNGSVSSSIPVISEEIITEDSNSDDDSDSEGDEDDQSSLDVKHIGRQTLKRRASDGLRTNTSIRDTLTNGRKGSLFPFEENAESVVATSLMYADVIWDRVALDNDELNFKVGDVVEILDMTDDVWWHGSVEDYSGWFPASFVRLRVGQDTESEDDSTSINSKTSDSRDASSECPPPDVQRNSDPIPDSSNSSSTESPSTNNVSTTLPRAFLQQQGNSVRRRRTIRRRDSLASTIPHKLSPDQVREKIIQEIISTERDYVRNLEDIIEGFLKQCQKYSKLFNDEQIEAIFSNVEQVYAFQQDFLRELEAKVKPQHIEQSEIGEVFIINQHEFKVYSLYCNNHPHAVSEMNLLHSNGQYTLFFESCRLLRNLPDISLEGFLLTPVQKICRYPLQLTELLKYTSESHPDYPHVVEAQKAMKNVALLINEQKRRIENVGKIGCWQKTMEGWKGPDILETSTEMIHNGELHKISKGHSQERHFFLFDHQLIYCKKEAIGGKLTYKGRLDLDNCQIADLSDKSAMHGNTPVKNGWRMNNKIKDKWYIIYARNPQVKEQWMNAFQRERERVREDEEKGFHISMKMKKAAVALCASLSSSTENRRRRSIHKKHVTLSESMDYVAKQRIDSSSGNKTLTVTSGMAVSPQLSKKVKSNKKKS